MTAPDLRVLSLGAGVQSTVLALMACDGTLPGLDAAIFADTGWEPPAVYAQVDRLEAELLRAGIPLHRVSQGNLRRDAADPDHRFASVPYFTLAPDGTTVDEPVYVPCPGCPGQHCAVCTGTGDVVDHYVTRTATRTEREGMGRRQCTSEYKLAPITRKLREMLGARAPGFRRVPKGRLAEQWVGFSTDEIGRVSPSRVSYLTTRHPLLDLDMSRKDCERWLRAAGWGHTAKSACIGCPFHGNAQWRELRDHHPEQWADAVAFDHEIRKGGASASPLTGEAFLHRSRVPLELAPIDRVTSREWHDRQGDLFDELAELGDPDGCSPYGCRSGEPVAP